MTSVLASSATFDEGGTRYELVLTQDPNGGVLVAWPGGAWLGRFYKDGLLVTLAGKLKERDRTEIWAWLASWNARLPWGTP